uniref:Transferrin-like domain-containing protein n=1 Tax=Megaselia scalaris TaxID=36166 RepID=T1GTP7_MEGSC
TAQYHNFNEHRAEKISWCTKNLNEYWKCENLTITLERDRALFDDKFLNLTCVLAYSADECIHHIDHDRAHITTLDAGDLFVAGRYHSMIPILQEKITGGFTNYYSVAVLKKGTLPNVHSLRDLRNTRACFPWVGSLAGWILPIYTLLREGGMEITDCNNQVKTASNFFNSSVLCIRYSTNIIQLETIQTSELCSLCTGLIPGGRCTHKDPYFGYDGAFRCLMESGDVAFLRHSTVFEMIQGNEFKNIPADKFELLCKDGRRVPITEYQQCNWGLVPTDALVTSSARTFKERKQFQRFLMKISELYSDPKSRQNFTFFQNQNQNQNSNDFNRNNNYFGNNNNQQYDPFNRFGRFNDFSSTTTTTQRSYYEFPRTNDEERPQNGTFEKFDIFESKRYGRLNSLFNDATKYLDKSMEFIYGIRDCPVGRMTLCVTSEHELEKCIKMRTALKGQLLKPELSCFKAHSQITCMQSIQTGRADVAVFDAGDVYTGGLNYDLIPFMSEIYNLGEPDYYVVAVGKEEDPDTDLTYLKGKYTCHTGINTAAGWTYPMAYLISNGWIRPYGCDSIRAAAEYFTKSCLPGALSNEYNTGVPYDSMCDLCHGTSYHYCRRDASEDYYGHTGAFRCLVEGGGDVAFVKHTTVLENTGGKRKEWWARNNLHDEFELMCPDGTRAEITEYRRCNLGKVKANAIVTRGGNGFNETELNTFQNLFIYAQQLFGRKTKMSLVSDATQQLRVIPREERRYDLYLGKDFMRARRITDCNSGVAQFSAHLALVLSVLLFTMTNRF